MLAAFADSSGPDTRGGADPRRSLAAETIARVGQIALSPGPVTRVRPL